MGAPIPEEDAAVNEAVWECVRLGWFEVVGTDENGVPRFRVTDAGKARVEQMLNQAEEGG